MTARVETGASAVQIYPEILAAIVQAVEPTKMPALNDEGSAYRFEVARFAAASIALHLGFYKEQKELDLEKAAHYLNQEYARNSA